MNVRILTRFSPSFLSSVIPDAPLMHKQKKRTAFQILDLLHIRGSAQAGPYRSRSFSIQRMCSYGRFSRRISTLYSFSRRYFNTSNCKHADHAYDDLFHTGIELLEDLDRTFLGDLVDSLDKLLSLHGIDLTHSCKMLRCESRDSFIMQTSLSRLYRCISDGEDTRIKYTDDISGISLVYDLTFTVPSSAAAGKDASSFRPEHDKLPCRPQICRNRYA